MVETDFVSPRVLEIETITFGLKKNSEKEFIGKIWGSLYNEREGWGKNQPPKDTRSRCILGRDMIGTKEWLPFIV